MDKKSKTHLKKLDQQLTLLLRDLQHYSDAKLNEQPSESSWSVLQIMQHLMKAEGGSIAYVKKKLSFNPDLEKAGIMSGLRSMMLNLSLSSPIKIKAPDNIDGDNLLKNLSFWDVAKSWNQQREELKQYLESLPNELFDRDLYKHPLTGKMTLANMLSFFSIHVDRHKKQIKRTLKKIDAVKQV